MEFHGWLVDVAMKEMKIYQCTALIDVIRCNGRHKHLVDVLQDVSGKQNHWHIHTESVHGTSSHKMFIQPTHFLKKVSQYITISMYMI